jgi:hypothetical protein
MTSVEAVLGALERGHRIPMGGPHQIELPSSPEWTESDERPKSRDERRALADEERREDNARR